MSDLDPLETVLAEVAFEHGELPVVELDFDSEEFRVTHALLQLQEHPGGGLVISYCKTAAEAGPSVFVIRSVAERIGRLQLGDSWPATTDDGFALILRVLVEPAPQVEEAPQEAPEPIRTPSKPSRRRALHSHHWPEESESEFFEDQEPAPPPRRAPASRRTSRPRRTSREPTPVSMPSRPLPPPQPGPSEPPRWPTDDELGVSWSEMPTRPAPRKPTPSVQPAPRRKKRRERPRPSPPPAPPAPRLPPAPPARPELAPVPSARLGDLDRRLVGWVVGRDLRSPEPIARKLIAADAAVDLGDRVVPTLAGLLALGKRPGRHFIGGRLLSERDDEELWYAGPLFRAISQAARDFAEPDDLAPPMLAELLLNAFAHRRWDSEVLGCPVRIRRLQNHLIVSSPSALPEGWFREPVHPNPSLLALFQKLQMAKGKGRGLKFVRQHLERREDVAFEFAQNGSELSVILHFKKPDAFATAAQPAPRIVAPAQATPAPTTPTTPAHTPTPATPRPAPPSAPKPTPTRPRRPQRRMSAAERQTALLAHLQREGSKTTRELIAELGWTRSTTRAVLAALVEDGRVLTEAASSRSPFQRYAAAR